MAATLQEISNLLNEIGFKHELNEENNIIVSGGGSAENKLAIFIELFEDGEMFQIEGRLLDDSLNTIHAKDHQHLNKLLVYLLERNFTTKFGTWEYNPESGLIRIMVEVPLEDNTLTKRQLERMVNMIISCEKEAGEIKHLLATGELPQMDEDEVLKLFEMMLSTLQKADATSSSSDTNGI